MGARNNDISLILAKAKKEGFLPDVKDSEVDILEAESKELFGGDAGFGNSFIARQVPNYAGARAHSWNGAMSLYNGESPTLRTIRSAIRRGRGGERIRLVSAGDSKTAGSGSTQPQVAVNSYPAQFAELLGAKSGIIPAVSWDTRWASKTGGFADQGGTSQNYSTGPAGAWSVTFTSNEAFTGFKVYAYISAGGLIAVTVDGVAKADFTVSAGSTWKTTSYTGLTDTVHTIVFSGTSLTSFYGLEPIYATGLTVSNAGRPSSSAAEWLFTADWSRLYCSTFNVVNSNMPRPDIAIIGIGTNTNSSTLDDITSFITNVSALTGPPVSVLLLAFGGVGASGNSFYDAKRTRLYDIADALDLPLVDFNALIGDSSAATSLGLMADTVHENSRGYSLEAGLLAQVLTF